MIEHQRPAPLSPAMLTLILYLLTAGTIPARTSRGAIGRKRKPRKRKDGAR
jgi:hypothetical protein